MRIKTTSPPITEHIIGTTVDVERIYDASIDTVLLKIASRCNINCTYCYVFNMGDSNWVGMEKLMAEDTINAVVSSLKLLAESQHKPFSIVLHGGEPLLLGPHRLETLLRKIREYLSEKYPIGIQTNGILISNQILDVCSRYKTNIAVSIDGPKKIHDRLRIDHKGSGTFDRVMKGITTLNAHPNSFFLNAGMLAVINPQSNPREVYSFFKEIGAPSVDFLYRDGNHASLPEGKTSIDSTEFGFWMSKLLEVYLNDTNPIPIRILDDMLKVILGGNVSKEGIGLTEFGILVVDTDGTLMKNDTLKSSFNGADRFIKQANVKNGNLLEFLSSDEFYSYKTSQGPSSSTCLKCPILHICGGGMKLHRWNAGNGFDNPSVYCSDQKLLVKNMRKAVSYFSSHA